MRIIDFIMFLAVFGLSFNTLEFIRSDYKAYDIIIWMSVFSAIIVFCIQKSFFEEEGEK